MVCALFYVWNLNPLDGFMMDSYNIRNAWVEISAIAAICEVLRQ